MRAYTPPHASVDMTMQDFLGLCQTTQLRRQFLVTWAEKENCYLVFFLLHCRHTKAVCTPCNLSPQRLKASFCSLLCAELREWLSARKHGQSNRNVKESVEEFYLLSVSRLNFWFIKLVFTKNICIIVFMLCNKVEKLREKYISHK